MKFRTVVAAISAAALTGGLGLGAVSPAQAALTETNYGYQATSFGTQVASELTGLESERTALSYIACTRLAGKTHDNHIAGVKLPATDSLINVGAVDSRTRTFTDKAAGIYGAVQATNNIARVTLGTADTPVLTIRGLEAVSTAWADKAGKLHSKNEIAAVRLSLTNLESAPEVGPLAELVDALDQGIAQVLSVIRENGNAIEIPGLGVVSVGFERKFANDKAAAAEAAVLRVLLYGTNQAKGGGDDSAITIGHSWARINKGLPAGVMTGRAYGATLDLIGGIVTTGEIGLLPLPCRGTSGVVKQTRTGGTIIYEALDMLVESVESKVLGQQGSSGWAYAWTAGSVNNLKLGPLEIKGIVGRANVSKSKDGTITRLDNQGSALGELILDGTSYGAFTPETASEIPAMEIPGVAKIEFFKSVVGKRSISTSAIVITVAEGTPGPSVIRLGNAHTKIGKY